MGNNKARVSPGDATGRKKAELAEEHAALLEEVSESMSLANAQQADMDSNAVHDPTSGDIVETPEGETVPPVVEEDPDAVVDLLAEPEAKVGDDEEEEVTSQQDVAALLDEQRQEFEAHIEAMREQQAMELAMLRQQIASSVDQGLQPPERVNLDEVLDTGVQIGDTQVVVARVNTTLEDVTIGAGQHFSFKEGRKYKMPRHVYDRLEELGYIYH